ncbi:MAG: SDR family oxidoreductase [Planctomycetota bacterium]|nr:MAG: SDR family oxidoreductase [Planctomycetota bacterium]
MNERPIRVVVGCGYLGDRVARRWVADGARVIGVTRRPTRAVELAVAGIEPAIVDVTAAAPGWESLFGENSRPTTVFWSVGFDRASAATHHDVHVTGLRKLLDALVAGGSAAGTRVIFSSSTGVWGDEGGGIVDETTPPNPGREAGRVLLEAETLLRTHPMGPGIALRFAGLYGPGRLPRLDDLRAGLPIAADPDSWLNLIHIDDAAAVVQSLAAAASTRPLYVVSDGHPVRRRDWYERLASLTGSPAPRWDSSAPRTRGADKRVDPSLLLGELESPLAHPDALQALPGLLAS